jgi:DNA polymerase-3 subunit alpha
MVRPFLSHKLSDLKPRDGAYLMGGIISAVRFRMTGRGKIAILTLDDSYARIDVIIGRDLLNESYNLIKEDQLLFVEGQVSPDDFTGGNRVSANKLYDLQTIQNLKAMMLIINIKNNIQSIDIKNILKPYTDLNINQNVKKCKVKIEYENDQGKAEILLGRDWEVMLHEDLITHLYQTFDNENVKILYN